MRDLGTLLQEFDTLGALYSILGVIMLSGPRTDELRSFASKWEQMGVECCGEEEGAIDGINGILETVRKASNERMQALDLEYTRLFVGPGLPPSPQTASYYLGETEGKMQIGEETSAVLGFYEKYGVVPAFESNYPADHIGVEFLFMAMAVGDATGNASIDVGANERFALQLDFLQQHIMTWVPQFAAGIKKSTDDSFYLELARLVEALPMMHCEKLKLLGI